MSKTQTKPKVAPKQPDLKKDEAVKPKTAPPTTVEAKKPEADKPKAEPAKKVTNKQRMIDMLNRPDGATDAELVKAFSWKGNHVARGQRSTLAKEYREKKTGLMLCKFTRTPSGDTAYKIEPIEEEKPQAA